VQHEKIEKGKTHAHSAWNTLRSTSDTLVLSFVCCCEFSLPFFGLGIRDLEEKGFGISFFFSQLA
jgi:hypothetical protein